jgi:hypothetical protein
MFHDTRLPCTAIAPARTKRRIAPAFLMRRFASLTRAALPGQPTRGKTDT